MVICLNLSLKLPIFPSLNIFQIFVLLCLLKLPGTLSPFCTLSTTSGFLTLVQFNTSSVTLHPASTRKVITSAKLSKLAAG